MNEQQKCVLLAFYGPFVLVCMCSCRSAWAPAAVTNRLFVCCVSRVYGGGYVLSDTVQDGACCCESKENSVVCSSDMVRGRSVWRCSWTLMPRCRMKAYVN